MDTAVPADYRLLDSGAGARLEQVGPHRLARPCPQAVWPRRLGPEAWAQADATYVRSDSGGGQWDQRCVLPAQWRLRLHGQRWVVKATGFGHLGVFPEQEGNWRWLQKTGAGLPRGFRALNLFAYTGGSTLALAHAGGEVFHVDAARGIVAWARDNAALQKAPEHATHWVVEDVMKFCHREVRREHRYAGIVLDPPTFGRGPTGEMWKIENDLPELLELCRQLLDERGPAFVVLSCHSPGFSPLVLENLLAAILGPAGRCECGEMTIPEADGARLLPSGCCARWQRS